MFDKPLSDKLLGQLFLRLVVCELLLIAVSIEIAAAVWCVYFVYEIYLTVALSKLIFRIDEYKTMLLCYFLSASEQLSCVCFHYLIIFRADNTLSYYLLFGNVQIMSLIGFCRRSYNRLRESLVLFHVLRQFHPTQFATTVLVSSPC